jgi:5-methylcytosine-specific restriction endonuclease McrA
MRKQRKARLRGAIKTERIYRKKVYERDKWRCQICGEKVDCSVPPDHPRAPTLDHIHPLKVPGDTTGELGGTHTYDNVRTAHYGCNSARGNRDEFQMRLPVAA